MHYAPGSVFTVASKAADLLCEGLHRRMVYKYKNHVQL